MPTPNDLKFDTLQSENFVEHIEGVQKGQGWRLCKNGDYQIGDSRQVNGELITNYGTLRISADKVDVGPGAEFSIAPLISDRMVIEAHATPSSIRNDRVAQESRTTDVEMDLVLTVRDLPHDRAEEIATTLKATLAELLGRELKEGECVGEMKASETVSLSSRIGELSVAQGTAWGGVGRGLDLGKEFLAIEQPGGDVTLGRLTGQEFLYKKGNIPHEFAGGLLKADPSDTTFSEQFLNREVRSDLKPSVACTLSMVAPITSNGKLPPNILPRSVDDVK